MILFQIIQKPQKRGAEIFAAQLSEHFEKLGHTVILISLFEGVSELPFSGKKIQLNRPISKRWYDYVAWQQIARLVKEFKPDIIQCNAGDTLKFMILSKLFLLNDQDKDNLSQQIEFLYNNNKIKKVPLITNAKNFLSNL